MIKGRCVLYLCRSLKSTFAAVMDCRFVLRYDWDVQDDPANPCSRLLPPMQEINHPQALSSQTAAKDMRTVAGKLLGQVSAIKPAWHARVATQQPACA